MTSPTVTFQDTFERADENPLSTNGWSSTTLRLLRNLVISTSTTDHGRAVQTTTPTAADQQVTGSVACGSVNPCAQLTVASLVAGSPATLTTAAHGVTPGSTINILLFGVTTTAGSINPNGVLLAAESTGATTFTIASGIATGTYTTTGAIAVPFHAVASVLGRVTGAATPPTTFQAGYELLLSWDPSSVRRVYLFRYLNDGATADQRVLLAQSTTSLVVLNGSDLGYAQTLRLSITDTREGVYLRGYVNNDDDDSPTISVTDRGRDFYLGSGTPFLPPCRSAGYFAVVLGPDSTSLGQHNGPILDAFAGSDNHKVEIENAYAGRTLAQLRDAVLALLGPKTNYPAARLNQHIQDAHEDFLREMGDMALFARRTETLALTIDDTRRAPLPHYVDRVDDITDLLRCPVRWHGGDYTDEGLITVYLPDRDGGSYLVSYYRRQDPLLDDTDRTIVPRRLDEAIVMNAAMRVAERDQDATRATTLRALWERALMSAKTHMHRQARQTRARMRPRPRPFSGISDRGAIW